MDLNDLISKYPQLFQFAPEELLKDEEKGNDRLHKAEFTLLNSKRSTSNPFYKPISKMIIPEHVPNDL